jgi:L-iditol 2-dehydrogenase
MRARQALLPEPLAAFEVVETEVPALHGGEMLIRQELCGVCGTDAHMWKGQLPGLTYPLVLGHETIGLIEDLGQRARTKDCLGRSIRPGDRVYVIPGIACGECYYCVRLHQPNLCMNGTGTGFNPRPGSPWLRGGWSEVLLIDDPRQRVVKLGPIDPQAGVFLEPLSVGVHALSRTAVHPGDTVVVQGAGAVGIGCLIAAKESGAHKTIVVGAPASRLRLASELGADVVIDVEEVAAGDERIQAVRSESHLDLGVDVVVECTGSPASITEGLRMLRRGGSYVVAGHFTDNGVVSVNPFEHLNNLHVNLYGSWGAEAAHFVQALPILESGRYDTARIVSHRVPLSRATEVCTALSSSYRLGGEEIRKVAIEASLT